MLYKSILLRYTPRSMHKLLRDMYFSIKLVPGHFYDYFRFLTYSGLNKSRNSRTQRAARITLCCHQIEKGLSLAAPRPEFGMAMIPRLFDDIDAYLTEYGYEEPAPMAISALQSYVEYHEKVGHRAGYVQNRLAAIRDKHQILLEQRQETSGGVLHLTREELTEARCAGFKSFFESRHSVRQFSGGEVPYEDIRRCVELARKTPSVCNRQSCRVHSFTEAKKMKSLLEIQNGSRGFGEQASAVLILTCELRCFLGIGERYQPWIDGGMFAMSLCLAFHDLGYGSCCLNWSKEPDADRLLRSAAAIPSSEQIIMLIAVGTLPEEFSVARSCRTSVDEVLVLHES